LNPANAPDDIPVTFAGVVKLAPILELKPLVELKGPMVTRESSCN
jgi:hypothetical protein